MKELWDFLSSVLQAWKLLEKQRHRLVSVFFFFFIILDVFHTEGELRATEFTSIVLNSRIGQCASRTSNLGYMFVPKISFLNLHLAKQKEGI